MPTYSWKGRNSAGNVQEGVLTTEDKETLVATLRKQQILVTAVTEKGKEFALPKFGGGGSQKEIAIFTVKANVPVFNSPTLVNTLASTMLCNERSNS